MVGKELLSSGTAGEGRRCVQRLVQDPRPLPVTGSGAESTFFRAAFALLTVKFTFSLFIIISPPLVALNLWCVKWFRGRKTCISNSAPFCGTRLVAPGIVGALRGARTSSGFVSTTLPLPRYRRCLFFSPVRDYLNDKLARLWTLRGKHPNLGRIMIFSCLFPERYRSSQGGEEPAHQ